jgi:large conductance mechanosensitive channel
MKYVLTEAVTDPETAAVVTPEVAIKYGQFIQYIIDFIIVAFCMFVVIKIFMGMRQKLENLKKKEEEIAEEAAPAEPSVEEKTLAVLGEIKSLLENK